MYDLFHTMPLHEWELGSDVLALAIVIVLIEALATYFQL